MARHSTPCEGRGSAELRAPPASRTSPNPHDGGGCARCVVTVGLCRVLHGTQAPQRALKLCLPRAQGGTGHRGARGRRGTAWRGRSAVARVPSTCHRLAASVHATEDRPVCATHMGDALRAGARQVWLAHRGCCPRRSTPPRGRRPAGVRGAANRRHGSNSLARCVTDWPGVPRIQHHTRTNVGVSLVSTWYLFHSGDTRCSFACNRARAPQAAHHGTPTNTRRWAWQPLTLQLRQRRLIGHAELASPVITNH